MLYLCLSFSAWNHSEKFYNFHYNLQKRLKFNKLGMFCGILHQEYLKMRVKKVNIFKDIKLENFNPIETFFSIYRNSIVHLWTNVAQFFKNSFIWED